MCHGDRQCIISVMFILVGGRPGWKKKSLHVNEIHTHKSSYHHGAHIVVSPSTCPPLSPSPHANSFIIGTAEINTHMSSTLPLSPSLFPPREVYGRRLVFVSERTNKRHHHHRRATMTDGASLRSWLYSSAAAPSRTGAATRQPRPQCQGNNRAHTGCTSKKV